MDWMQGSFKVPRLLAMMSGLVLDVVVLVILWCFVWVSVSQLLDEMDTYQNRFNELVEQTVSWLPMFVFTIGEEETDVPSGSADIAGELPALTPEERARQLATQKIDRLASFLRLQVGKVLVGLSGSLMDILSQASVVLIFLLFLLLGDSTGAVPKNEVWADIESRIRSYIVTKTIISAITGAVFGFVLWLFGVPLAMVFGVLAFLFNFIPNIGPIIASLLPLPLILLHPELSGFQSALVIALAFGVQFLSGNVLEPKIMGESFHLHPITIMVMLMLWGMLWGIVGMLLATPITAVIKILLEKFDRTRPVARILEGRFDKFRELSADAAD
jgi:AI-2 transport protein TqsA